MLQSIQSHEAAMCCHSRIIHYLCINSDLHENVKLALCVWLDVLEEYLSGNLNYNEARKLLIILMKKSQALGKRQINKLAA